MIRRHATFIRICPLLTVAVFISGCGTTATSQARPEASPGAEAARKYVGSAIVALSLSASGSIDDFSLTGTLRGDAAYAALQEQVAQPGPLAFGADGTIFVVDRSDDSIHAFDPDGNPLVRWTAHPGGELDPEGPAALATLPTGSLIVADYSGNRVVMLGPDGEHERSWGQPGDGQGQFDGPSGIAVDAAGSIYVVDSGNNRVQKFNQDDIFVAEIGTTGRNSKLLEAPLAIAIDVNDVLYVIDGKRRVATYDTDGLFIGQFGEATTGSESFVDPVAIVADNCGSVWVADRGQTALLKFSTHGYFRNAVSLSLLPEDEMNLASIYEVGSCVNDGA